MRRTPQRHSKEKYARKNGSDPVTGNIHQAMQNKEDRGDQGGQPEALIGSLLQWKNSPNEDRDPSDGQKNHRPSHFDPEPKPIALGMDRAGAGQRCVAKDREDGVEISQADAAPGRSANELESVPENCPAQIRGHVSRIAGTEMKAFEGLPAEDQHHRQQNEQRGKAERNPRRRALAQGERAEPECASGHKNEDAGAREIEDDRGDDDSESEQPNDPAFPAVPDIILAARQDHDRRETEKIGRLIAIWKRPESTLVVPERKGGVSGMECDAKRGEQDDASSEKSKLLAHFPQLQIERADVVKPAQAGQKTDKASEGNPGLRRKCAGEADAEIVLQDKTPRRLQKPARRQECRGRKRSGGQQDQVQAPSQRQPGRIGQQDEAQQSNDDAFAPFLGRATEETGEHRKRGDRNILPPPAGGGGETGAYPGSLFLHRPQVGLGMGLAIWKASAWGVSWSHMNGPVLPRVERGLPSRTLIIGFGK